MDSHPETIAAWMRALSLGRNAATRWVRRGVLELGSMDVETGRAAVAQAQAAGRTRRKGASPVPASREAMEADISAAEAHAALKLETAKKTRAQRIKLELQTAEMAGRLLPAAEVRERWLTMTARWVATMRAMPMRYESDMAALTGLPVGDCRRFLAEIVGKSLDQARLSDADG